MRWNGNRVQTVALSQLATLALPQGAAVAVSDLGGAAVYNTGTLTAPVWTPVNGGSIEYELSGFSHATNYLASASETTSLGLTASLGTLIWIVRDQSYGGQLVSGGNGQILWSKMASGINGVAMTTGDKEQTLGTDNVREWNFYGGLVNSQVADSNLVGSIQREIGDVLVYVLVFNGASSILSINGREYTVNTTGFAEAAATRFAFGDGPDGNTTSSPWDAMTTGGFFGAYDHPGYQFTRSDRANFLRNVKQLGPSVALVTEKNNRVNSACLRASQFNGTKISWEKNGTPAGSAILSDQTMAGALTWAPLIVSTGKAA